MKTKCIVIAKWTSLALQEIKQKLNMMTSKEVIKMKDTKGNNREKVIQKDAETDLRIWWFGQASWELWAQNTDEPPQRSAWPEPAEVSSDDSCSSAKHAQRCSTTNYICKNNYWCFNFRKSYPPVLKCCGWLPKCEVATVLWVVLSPSQVYR